MARLGSQVAPCYEWLFAGRMSSADPKTVFSVCSWFALNICMGNLNGWILKRHGFSYPVLLTAIHMVCCWALSGALLTTVMTPDVARPASSRAIRKVRTLSLAFCAGVRTRSAPCLPHPQPVSRLESGV